MPEYLFKVGNVKIGIEGTPLPSPFLPFKNQGKYPDIALEILKFDKRNSSQRKEMSPILQKSLSSLPPFFLKECLGNPLLYDRIISKKIEMLGCDEQPYFKIGSTHLMVSSYNKGRGIFVSTFEYEDSAKRTFLGGLCNSLFPRFNASLLHSAGVVRKGKALLFLGPGAAGKTTTTNLSEDFILSDDQVLVQRVGKKFLASSTPFGRKTDGPMTTEIRGLFFLKKGKRFLLREVKPIRALLRAWYFHTHLFHNFPPIAKSKLFLLFYELFKEIPSYEMEFTKEFIDWDKIDRIAPLS